MAEQNNAVRTYLASIYFPLLFTILQAWVENNIRYLRSQFVVRMDDSIKMVIGWIHRASSYILLMAQVFRLKIDKAKTAKTTCTSHIYRATRLNGLIYFAAPL